MEKHVFSTPFGEAWLWGEAPEGERPLVLSIDGAFAIERPRSFELASYLPEAAVLNAHLPGNHCPEPVSQSVGVYAALYGDVLRQIGRPAVVVGASVGALVALGLHQPLVKGLVAVEPPLLTGKIWPLVASLRGWLARHPDDAERRAFIWNVLGVSEDAHENRDYRGLLDQLRVPAWAMFGAEPLGAPRAYDVMPSLVDEPERALLRAHPLVQTREVDGVGHNVPGRGVAFVRTCTRDLLNRLFGTDVPAANREAS